MAGTPVDMEAMAAPRIAATAASRALAASAAAWARCDLDTPAVAEMDAAAMAVASATAKSRVKEGVNSAAWSTPAAVASSASSPR